MAAELVGYQLTVENIVDHHIANWLGDPNKQQVIIDAGMGWGKVGYKLRGGYPEHKLKIYGYDVYEPAMKFAAELGNAYSEIRALDLGKVDFPHSDKVADVGISLGVLAHLTKEEGFHLLKELDRVCKHFIVTAPTVLFQHRSHGNDPNIEPLRHKSFWSAQDFMQSHMHVRGWGIRDRTEKSTFLDTFFSPWTYALSAIHPRLSWFSGGLVAWK